MINSPEVNKQLRNFDEMAGIYIHIPFCKQKCTYCDFHFSTTFTAYRNEMIDSMLTEIKDRRSYLENKKIETIYFGGGTPSLLTKNEIESFIAIIKNEYTVNDDAEITLEANPDDITITYLNVWKKAGINRLSIGLQSFKQADLDWMNRAHSVEEGLNCIELAQKTGITNLTVDLIYGLPNLTMEEWKSHVQRIIDMGVPHLSAYCLTVEDKTVLDNWVRKGKIKTSSEDLQSEQFLALLEMMEENGFQQYEISNFSKTGCESKHNSNYWNGEWYLGIGPSAHSFNGTSRRWNVANNQKYIAGIKANEVVFETEILTIENQFNEKILTGLRTVYGVELKELEVVHALNESFVQRYESFIEKDWMELTGGILCLTREGKLRADYIASELFIDSN